MESNQQQLPEIKQTPVWKADDKIEMYGVEFEKIFNTLNNLGEAYMAAHSILNRNLINGVVKMDFQKINPSTGGYESLSEAEQKPYQDELKKAIDNALKEAQQGAGQNAAASNPQTDSQEGVPFIDSLVDANGQPVSSTDEDKPKASNLRVV